MKLGMHPPLPSILEVQGSEKRDARLTLNGSLNVAVQGFVSYRCKGPILSLAAVIGIL